jgi:hypothetical protein
VNEPRLRQFEGRVARIVAPLVARAGRKRMIREELLSHFWQVYEEERDRLGEDAAAADATLGRMGDADELSSQLQASVPLLETLICLCLARKELFMGRWLWLLLGCLAALFGTSMILPVLAKMKHSGSLPSDAAEALGIGIAILLAGLVLLGYGIKRLRRAS